MPPAVERKAIRGGFTNPRSLQRMFGAELLANIRGTLEIPKFLKIIDERYSIGGPGKYA